MRIERRRIGPNSPRRSAKPIAGHQGVSTCPSGPRRLSRCRRKSGARRALDRQSITDRHSRPPDHACGQLHGDTRAQGCGHAPGAEPFDDLHDASRAIDEEDVDRKLHAYGMNRIARRQHEGMAIGQHRAAEETAATTPRVECGFHRGGDQRAGVAIDQLTGHLVATYERPQKWNQCGSLTAPSDIDSDARPLMGIRNGGWISR